MRIISLYFRFFFITLFLSACNYYNPQVEKPIPVKLDLKDSQVVRYSDLFTDLDYIILQLPKNQYLGEVGKLFFTDNYIGVIDRIKNSIWIFNNSGQYVNKIDVTIGKGPGEVLTLSDATFGKNNEVHILGAFRINTFNIKGDLKNEIHFSSLSRSFEYVEEGNFFTLFFNNEKYVPNGNTGEFFNLITIDSTGKTISYFNSFSEVKANLTRLSLTNFYKYKDTLHHFSFLDRNIYKLMNANTIRTKYNLNVKNEIPSSIFEKKENYKTGLVFLKENIFNQDYPYLNIVFETDRYLFVRFTFNINKGVLIYDKKNKLTTISNKFLNDFDERLDVYLHAGYKNYLYGIKSVIEMRKYINKRKDSTVSKRLSNIVDSLSNNIDYILVRASFKN